MLKFIIGYRFPGQPGYRTPILYHILNFTKYKLHINTYRISKFIHDKNVRKVQECVRVLEMGLKAFVET